MSRNWGHDAGLAVQYFGLSEGLHLNPVYLNSFHSQKSILYLALLSVDRAMKILSFLLFAASALLVSSAPVSSVSDLDERACVFDPGANAYSCTQVDSKAIPATPVINNEVDHEGRSIKDVQKRDAPAEPEMSFGEPMKARAEVKRQCLDDEGEEECQSPPAQPTMLCWIDDSGNEVCEGPGRLRH